MFFRNSRGRMWILLGVISRIYQKIIWKVSAKVWSFSLSDKRAKRRCVQDIDRAGAFLCVFDLHNYSSSARASVMSCLNEISIIDSRIRPKRIVISSCVRESREWYNVLCRTSDWFTIISYFAQILNCASAAKRFSFLDNQLQIFDGRLLTILVKSRANNALLNCSVLFGRGLLHDSYGWLKSSYGYALLNIISKSY